MGYKAGKPDEIFSLEYEGLRAMAIRFLTNNPRLTVLSPTVLVHEVYLRVARGQAEFEDRGHFLATAAAAMRQIMVDHARKRARSKRGGELFRVTLIPEHAAAPASQFDLLLLDDALNRLREMDPRAARVVDMRFFAGLSVAEIAELEQTSERTVKRDWGMARAWLQQQLGLSNQ